MGRRKKVKLEIFTYLHTVYISSTVEQRILYLEILTESNYPMRYYAFSKDNMRFLSLLES